MFFLSKNSLGKGAGPRCIPQPEHSPRLKKRPLRKITR
jgi:hypothetical protein